MILDPSLWGSYAGTFADWEEEGAAMTTPPHLPPHAANLGVSDSHRCAYCLTTRHESVMLRYEGRWFCKRKCWRHRLTTPRGR